MQGLQQRPRLGGGGLSAAVRVGRSCWHPAVGRRRTHAAPRAAAGGGGPDGSDSSGGSSGGQPAKRKRGPQKGAKINRLRRDMSDEQQDQQWQAIWELIGCTSEAERSRVQKQGDQLLTMPLEVLQQRLAGLVAALGGDAVAAKAACRRAPLLLTFEQETLKQHTAALQPLLDVDSRQLAKLVSSQPAILGSSPDTLARKVQALQALLDVGKDQLAKLFSRHPSLLSSSPDTLASKVQALSANFGGRQAAVEACVQSPSLLSSGQASLAAKAAALQALLGLESSEQLALLLRRSPSLLTFEPDSLKTKLQQLVQRLSLSRGEVQQLAAAMPSLLTTTPEVVAAKWRLIQAYTGPGGSLGLSSKAACLVKSLDRLARLEYLASVVAAADPGAKLLSAVTALNWTDLRFNARYPGFPGWLAANAARLEDENRPLKLRGKDAAAAAAAARDPTKQRPRARRRGGVVGDAAAAESEEDM